MFAKLAIRNVRRQVGNYLIYFVTVAFSVAMLFSICNVIYSSQLQKLAESISSLDTILLSVSGFVAAVTAFVLGYATSFMLRLRTREFGMYMTLGMTRKNILTLFLCETMIISTMALGAGIAGGLLIYQGLMALLMKLMEMDIELSAYSSKGLAVTLVICIGMFIISSLTSVVYLGRVSINSLLHGEKQEKSARHMLLWVAITITSFIAIVFCGIKEYEFFRRSLLGDPTYDNVIFVWLLILAVFMFLFHMGLAQSLGSLLLCSKRICSKGTNVFILRQLSGKMSVNSVMMGLLSVLIAFAVIGANVSLLVKVSMKDTLEKSFPFDVAAYFDDKDNSPISKKQGEKIINEYSNIANAKEFRLLTSGEDTLGTALSECQYDEYVDIYISLSDFNDLLERAGFEKINLENRYLIINNSSSVDEKDFQGIEPELNGRTYTFAGITKAVPVFNNEFFYAVIPDEAAEGMKTKEQCVVYQLSKKKFDAAELKERLTYDVMTKQGYSIERCSYRIREYARLDLNSRAGVLAVGMMFAATVFICMALAMLSLKTLSSVQNDRWRYEVLNQIGVDERGQCQTLFYQIFAFFILPFILPVLVGILTGIVSGRLFTLIGFEKMFSTAIYNSVVIAIVLISLYGLYFTITYQNAKRNVILSRGRKI